MMKKIILSFLLFGIFYSAIAQQAVFSQYYFNPVFYNPALTGNAYKLTTKLQYKSLWTGLDAAPATAVLCAHSPIGLSSSSLGITLINDQLGLTSNSGAYISYAYRFQTKGGRIVAGTQLNFDSYKENLTNSHPNTLGDPTLNSDFSVMLFNIGLGLAWENENGYFGISTPGLLSNSISETSANAASKTQLQFNIIGAYTLDINSTWQLTPSLLYKFIETTPSQLDMQLHFNYNEQLQFDIGYRTNTTYVVGVSYILLNQFQIGYSYDYDNSAFGSTTSGSHELMFGYLFNKNKID